MKKFGILLLSLCMATPALADFATNCTNFGGTIITANSYGNDKGGYCNDPNDSNLPNNCNGKQFCLRNTATNWWSAFTWCDVVGGHLASFYSMCPNTKTNTDSTKGTCANLTSVGTRNAWTSMGWGKDHALYVVLTDGTIGRSYNYRTDNMRYAAFCEE